MVFAFIAGWVLGSVSLYVYLVMTAKEPPFPECMDCNETSCDKCIAGESEQHYRLAA